MPRGVSGTTTVDKHAQLDKSIETLEALLRRKYQEKRRRAKRDYADVCRQIAIVVEACGVLACDHEEGRFMCDLGELETLLKAGKRAVKEKRGEVVDAS